MGAGKTLQSTIEIAGVLSPSLQEAIRGAVSKLDEMSNEALASAGAAEKLSAEISAQESVLRSLQKGYADYVVSGRESSSEAQTLSNKIQELSGELNENKGSLKAAETAAQSLANTQDDTADAYTLLENKINSQQSELDALCREYANVALELGKTSTEAKQLESKIQSLSGELKENKQKLNDVGDAAKRAGNQAEESSEGYTMLKDVISDLASDAIKSAIEGFKNLALEGGTALSLLGARTGASATEMEGYKDVLNNVYNDNYGESIGDVSEVLSTVIQMTDDLDNASLEQITKNTIALNDIFGFDTTESMRAVNSLMKQFGVTSDEAFNLIVQGAQKGLDQNGDLLDTINEYSVQFESAGFTADEMFNMLANGAAEGTWSVDKLGDAVKEYNIRMSDGTVGEALKENRKALGLTKEEADALAKAYGQGGEAGAAAMKQTLEAIMSVEDENKRYQLGVEMFGTMWEDLGEDAVNALFNTEGAIKSTNNAMAEADASAYDNLASSLSALGRTIKAEVLQPIVEKLSPILKKGVDWLTSQIGPAVDYLTEKMPVLGAVIGGVGAAIAAVKIGGFVSKIGKLFDVLKGGLGGLMSSPGGSSGGGGGLSNVKNVAKTMGSIAVAIGSVAAIVAAFGALRKIDGFDELMADGGAALKQLCDIIADIGLVGAAFVAFVAVVGKNASIKNVATGMADIAIALGGMGAIVTAFGLLSQIDGFNDVMGDGGKTLSQLCDIITDIGLVGGAFVAAAGLIGMIPIAVLTSGMANIAIALGGMEAVVLAFGALAQIDGIDKFMTDGGNMLVRLCSTLGEMAGALIGGALEGITDSLPDIGTNFAGFAENVKPLFDIINDVDPDGLAAFSGAFVDFVLAMAADSIVSLITGGTDYGALGTNLSDLATNSAGFFDMVSGLSESTLSNATALFTCLSTIDQLPPTGGLAQWFSGDSTATLTTISAALPDLGRNVAMFFKLLGTRSDFSGLTTLFTALSSIDKLPPTGGLAQWFSGDATATLTTISAALPALGKNVSAFFVAVKNRSDFSGISSLFTTLSAIDKLPPTGGLAQWFSGDSTATLTTISAALPDLGTNIAAFFTAIGNRINFTPLTALFTALAGIETMPATGGLKGWFSGEQTNTLTAISGQLPDVGKNIASFFTSLRGRTDFTPISNLFNTLSSIEIDSDAASKGFLSLGTSDLEAMGSGLSSFATNAAPFFEKINNFDVSKMASFFDELATVGSLPESLSSLDTTVGTALSNIVTTTETKMTAIRDAINIDESVTQMSASLSTLSSTVSSGTAAIQSTTSSGWSSVNSDTTTKWESIRNTIASKLTAAQQQVGNNTGAIESATSSAWTAVNSDSTSKWSSIANTISSKLTSSKSLVSSAMGSIASTMSSKLSSAATTASSKFGSIVSTISSKMQTAKSEVSSALDTIKKKFDGASWSLPKIKMPHIKIKGEWSFNPPEVPSFSVSWYKHGGILTEPTVFGAMGNTLLAGGEAGAEAVLPLKVLWDKMESILRSILNTSTSTGAPTDAGLTAQAGKLLTLDDFSLGSLAGGGVVVYYDFSGFTWSPQIHTGDTGDGEDDFMAKLRAHEAEFFDWLEEFIHMREEAQYA